MRGEHRFIISAPAGSEGSSPHARGAPTRRRWSWCSPGIIPACAGSTCGPPGRPSGRRDHPRMRGEHAIATVITWITQGSSPHARGAQVPAEARALVRGIIPACAGSTLAAFAGRTPPGDHPRMRGEHAPASIITGYQVGSSPHARGALRRFRRPRWRGGIIPACAGSTVPSNAASATFGDHPRMRGEHFSESTTPDEPTGSSPHARGAPEGAVPLVEVPGIIPACAGSTWAP